MDFLEGSDMTFEEWLAQEIVAKTKQVQQTEQALNMLRGALISLQDAKAKYENISINSEG